MFGLACDDELGGDGFEVVWNGDDPQRLSGGIEYLEAWWRRDEQVPLAVNGHSVTERYPEELADAVLALLAKKLDREQLGEWFRDNRYDPAYGDLLKGRVQGLLFVYESKAVFTGNVNK